MSAKPKVVIHTDGACSGNPGPGGWGVVIIRPDGSVIERGGGAALTTNNKMELTGAIQALAEIRQLSGPVAVYTDSTYVIQGISGWVHGWKRRGWKTATGSNVLNRDLWEQLDALCAARGARTIAWHYVRGHVGVVERNHGTHVYPDSVSVDGTENPQWLYTVVFKSQELWGDDADPTITISIDAFEPYLDPA